MRLEDRFSQAGERLSESLKKVAIPATTEIGWRWWRVVAATAVIVLVVGGSLLWVSRSDGSGQELAAGTVPTGSTLVPVTTTMVDLMPECEVIPRWPAAAAGRYTDEPVYDDSEAHDLAVAAQRYASTLPGFERLWIDQGHNKWVAVGFVGTDLDESQAQLDEAFPGAGVVAVGLDYTGVELEAFGDSLAAELPAGMTVHEIYAAAGYVGVWVGVASPERVGELAAVVDDRPVCWKGHKPDEVVPEGAQVGSGEGWRYLAEVDGGIPGQNSQLVTTEADLGVLWSILGARGPVPTIDFASEIVLSFEVGYNDSCPETRFDGIEVASDVVNLLVVDPTIGTGPPRGCNYDYMGRSYVVAILRAQLPSPPFTIKHASNGAVYETVETSLQQPETTPDP